MLKPMRDPGARLRRRILRGKWLSRLLGRKVEIRESWAKMPAEFSDTVEFLNWFDAAGSIEESIERARKDWKYRFQSIPFYASVPKGKALEIGFGGGRLILPASQDFGHVYGIDIHEAFERTEAFLRSQGANNFTLLHRDQIGTLPAGTIDFIYSFIVFQHFDTFEEVNYYLEAIERLLTPEGYAHIYFGKNRERGIKTADPKAFVLRDLSLFVEPEMMAEVIGERFEILDLQTRLPRDPEKGTGESVQASIAFRRKR